MELTWQAYAIVCPLVFLAGLIDSIAGGGGLISLPAYYMAGLDPALAAGTNKLSAGLGTLASSTRFITGKKILWRVAVLAALAAFPGSSLGAWLMELLKAQENDNLVRILMVVLTPVVACVVLFRKDGIRRAITLPRRLENAAILLIGFVIGFYDGLLGPGTGTFLILCFTMLLGMDGVLASGTAKIVNLTSNAAALITYAQHGDIIIGLGLPAALCGMAGNWLGASLTIKRGTGFIRGVLLVVLTLLMVKMVYDVLSGVVTPDAAFLATPTELQLAPAGL